MGDEALKTIGRVILAAVLLAASALLMLLAKSAPDAIFGFYTQLSDVYKRQMFTKLIDALKATRRTIVFTEGPDARILEAASRLLKEDLMDVILIGNEAEVKAAAEKGNFCICKATIIDPATYDGMDEMVAKMVELRKGKMSEEDCRAALAKGNYFGTMLVKLGKADALPVSYTHLDVYKRQDLAFSTTAEKPPAAETPSTSTVTSAKIITCLLYTSRCV